MKLARFVESLLADGRVRVSAAIDQSGMLLVPTNEDLDETASILVNYEKEYRTELPGNPPTISLPALLWGALTTFRATSFLAHRDAGEQVIRQAFSEPCPEKHSPSVSYSVDLTLRFLPDLVRLAKAASETDPLVDVLMSAARDWPLSSVGVAGVGSVNSEPLSSHECLLRMYVDRVIATKDKSRLAEPKFHAAVQAAIGIHREFAPELFQETVANLDHST